MSLCTSPQRPTGKILWSSMWQSWVLRPCTLEPSALMHLVRLEAYPYGNRILFRNPQNVALSSFSMAYHAASMETELPSSCSKCNSGRMPISYKSSLTLTVSLFLPSRWSIMPRRASHIFFSICITSRLCGSFKCFQ